MPLEFRPASRENILRNDPLREFSVDWLERIDVSLLVTFRVCIDGAGDERPIQQFLTEHPILLACVLHGGHGRWIIPQARLGAEFVPDFVLGEGDSDGVHWTLVELESPAAKLFTKKGPPSMQLNQAMYQVRTWRSWLEANRDYATRSPTGKGLGLTDINPATAAGLILLGRRAALTAKDIVRRKDLHAEQRIVVHTYDWLFEVAEGVVLRSGKE
jgi:hypothetical protein